MSEAQAQETARRTLDLSIGEWQLIQRLRQQKESALVQVFVREGKVVDLAVLPTKREAVAG